MVVQVNYCQKFKEDRLQKALFLHLKVPSDFAHRHLHLEIIKGSGIPRGQDKARTGYVQAMQKALPQTSGQIFPWCEYPCLPPYCVYIYIFTSKYNLLMPNVIELSIWWRISLNFHITNCTYDFVIDLPASICLTHDSERGIAMVLSRLELQKSARYVDISNYVVV